MRVPNATHAVRPWRVREITQGFRLEDVWELPGGLGPDDFLRLVELVAGMDPSRSASPVVRALFAVRWRLGELLHLDDPDGADGSDAPSLRDRLPADLQAGPSGPALDALPFTPLYLTEDEWAAEVGNRTMHGVLHLGRVPDGEGSYRAQMAVYVQPHGLLGIGYMAAIRPFRHLLVYPQMLREMGRRWDAETARPRGSTS